MNIAALLSGGVDSSVVVHLLCEQGYRPTLFYIKIGMDGAEYMDCSAEEDIEMSINGKTNCSTFTKHFVPNLILLTQNKMCILIRWFHLFTSFVYLCISLA